MQSSAPFWPGRESWKFKFKFVVGSPPAYPVWKDGVLDSASEKTLKPRYKFSLYVAGSPHSQTPWFWDKLWEEAGEPGSGKEWELKYKSEPSIAAGGVTALMPGSVLAKKGINRIKQTYMNLNLIL